MVNFESPDMKFSVEQLRSLDIQSFNDYALQLFQFQSKNNPVYRLFIEHLGINPSKIEHYSQIPCLPVEFWKNHKMHLPDLIPNRVFRSSSTTGTGQSISYLCDETYSDQIALATFTRFFGNGPHTIGAMLPGYQEREDSSLIYMVKSLMHHYHPGHYPFLMHHNHTAVDWLVKNPNAYLFGVTWSLLELAQSMSEPLSIPFHIIETGGMKGREKEPVRAEIYAELLEAFPNARIHSEYGMTELHAMFYARKNALYENLPWARVLIRDKNDPFETIANSRTGKVDIIDLSGYTQCAFISTSDLGILHNDHTFEILGRMDHSDIRGCSLLAI